MTLTSLLPGGAFMAKKILIVEDFDDTRTFLRFYLEMEGHIVVEAVTGREAIEMAAETPDLILMDYNLPEMDGLVATRLIKANPASENIPIVMITAYRGEIFKDAITAGCQTVLSKPVNFRELRKAIETAI